ncbi:MAG: DUF5074 domain-containing protein [Flavobacterium sp.]
MKNITIRTTIFSIVLFLFQFYTASAQYTEGVFVLNEGGAGSGNASVSFINNDAVTNNIYGSQNPGISALGDTAQSISFNGDFAYIVLNISNTIKVVNRSTFAYVATISTGISNPRYMAFANGKGYVTNWGDGGTESTDYLAVINLEDNSVETTISIAKGSERILTINEKLYVAHQGGFGVGNTISVINPTSQLVEQSIEVGDVPNSLLVKDEFLYVLCAGKPSWYPVQTDGRLVKIDLATNAIVSTLEFPEMHPNNLEINAAATHFFYTVDENIYTIAIDSTTLPTAAVCSLSAQGVYGIYGMDLIDDKIYVADAGNYASPGTVYIFSTAGILLQDFTVGVIPNSFYKAINVLGNTTNTAAVAMSLYPNPASDIFYVNNIENAAIKIYDATGRLAKELAYTTSGVSTSDLSAGIYFVEISSNSSRSVQRLIVK